MLEQADRLQVPSHLIEQQVKPEHLSTQSTQPIVTLSLSLRLKV